MLRRRGGGRAWRRFAALIWAGAGLWVLSACVMTPVGVAVNPATATAPRVRVVAGSVGLYAEADLHATRRGDLVRYDEAAALGRAHACRWLYVRTEDGRSGWIPANSLFVTLDSPCEEVAKGIVAPPAPLAQDAEALTVRGRLAYLAQNYAQAVNEYTQALAADASYSLAYHGRGAAQAALGDVGTALADYDAALNLTPDLLPALRDRSAAYVALGRFEEALADLDRVDALRVTANSDANSESDGAADAGDAVLYTLRGRADSGIGDYAQAVDDFSRALELNPTDATLFFERGLAYVQSGDSVRAIADWSRAIGLDPAYAAAYANRGLAHALGGHVNQAIADYSKALELVPTDARASMNRGLAYAAQRDFEQALRDADQAVVLDPQSADAYYNRGYIHYQAGHNQEAVGDLQKALELNPNAADREQAEELIERLQEAK